MQLSSDLIFKVSCITQPHPGSVLRPSGTDANMSMGKEQMCNLLKYFNCLCHKQKRSTKNGFLKPEEFVESFAHLTRPPYHCLAKWPTGVLQYIA